ncbi:MAG: ImmA/IrrE family metallo-endopeptidase [Coleofasciculus chthonoplastes F3-SA18-01]|uniref:ImmA/IrrE family metallo-endopeptidase n=1 Tax=Coleofasciculus chthonoplastes TaxID=64178 RepID=UPI0032F3F014
MNQSLTMTTLYDRLSKFGFTKKFIREQVLPDWWDSELENNYIAVTEAAGYISKRLGLDIRSLLHPDLPITFKQLGSPKFKKRKSTDKQSLLIAQGMATRVAEMVTYSFKTEYVALPQKASEIRNQILQENRCLDLCGLLKFCCSHGVPVIHFSNFPPTASKMEGMAAKLNNRPVIVISLYQRYSAWLLFITAHELGHLVKEHVSNGILVDEHIKPSKDIEEVEANNFATELLLGSTTKYTWGKELEPVKLAAIAKSVAERDSLDPGVLVLNYAWTRNQWDVGMKALELIEPDANAPANINRHLVQYLDWNRLDMDSQDYLKMVIGVE